ncbi:hypothetical protein ACN47E_007604 [Coniothyrium glycines]
MRFTEVIAASLVAPLVVAHGGIEGAPKMFGLPRNMRAGNPFAGHQARRAAAPLVPRQGGDAEGRCGTQGGGASCAAGFCCSGAGYCGTTKDHCAAPDCQIDFGPACDANKSPSGDSTLNDVRTQLGSIAYGGLGIRSCTQPGVVAITYDDGPYIYTEQVMAKFEARGGRATFFVTGNNIGKGAIDETQKWREVIQKMDANGHQVGSHTWTHQNLDLITQEQRIDQMTRNEMAIRNILGKYPTYMRPPYSACVEQPCMDDMQTLGYVITSFDLDTDDYNQLTTEKIQIAKDNFKAGTDLTHHLSIAHDIHELTALNLTDYMLDYVYSKGLRAVTVGECMNDPKANWYRTSKAAPFTPSSSAPVPTPTGPTSTDGFCGAVGNGQSCISFKGIDGLADECCSPYGYCGRTADHCGASCQPGFGKCGIQVVSSSASSRPTLSSSVRISSSSAPHIASSTPVKTSTVSVHVTSSVKPSGISSAPSATPTTSGEKSRDGSCGGEKGYTCAGFKTLQGESAECCSEWGYCGNTNLHCNAQCNPIYGICPGQSSSVVHASSSAAQSSSAAVHSSASVSQSAKHESSSSPVSKASSTGAHPASTVASVSKDSYTSGSVSAKYPASTPVQPSGSVSSKYHVSTPGVPSIKYPASTPLHSEKYPASTPVYAASSKYPVHAASSKYPVNVASSKYPEASSTKQYPASTPIYKASTLSTLVKPSSTPCATSAAVKPTPTPVYKVSKDGKCGEANNGQTCAGYKDAFGAAMNCCCKQSGRCSNDPWACSAAGRDEKYGKY